MKSESRHNTSVFSHFFGGGLGSRLLRSHLSLAVMGVFMLIVPFIGIINLQSHSDDLALYRAPMSRASKQVLIGLQQSLSALRGWMALGNPKFKEERQFAWRELIWPSVEELNILSQNHDGELSEGMLKNLREHLAKLWKAQWWIEDVAQVEGNEPTNVVFIQEMLPMFEIMFESVSSVIEIEEGYEASIMRKVLISHMADLRASITRSQFHMSAYVYKGSLNDEFSFHQSMAIADVSLDSVLAEPALLSKKQYELMLVVRNEWSLYKDLARQLLEMRKIDSWNLSQYWLKNQAIPHAERLNIMLTKLSDHQSESMYAESKDLSFAINTILVVLAVLILIMTLSAFIISSIGSRRILKPVSALAKASHQLAQGNLKENIPVTGNDEIALMTSAFNEMRSSLELKDALIKQEADTLLEQKRTLEKVNKELDSFVYTASHDLRAPLRGISSYSTFLIEDYFEKLDDEGKNFLNRIKRGAEHLSDLIDDLLNLSRISRIKNPFEIVNIHEIIDSIQSRIEFDLEKNNVDLIIQKDLPIITCDRIKITELFLNLINNGIKFSSKNTKDNPRIEIGAIDSKEVVEFFVTDNGIGIDPKYHDQVFGIFKRLHTESEFEGTGAGLSIVKRIVDEHQGKIWIKSELGKGASFRFSLPKNLKNFDQSSE